MIEKIKEQYNDNKNYEEGVPWDDFYYLDDLDVPSFKGLKRHVPAGLPHPLAGMEDYSYKKYSKRFNSAEKINDFIWLECQRPKLTKIQFEDIKNKIKAFISTAQTVDGRLNEKLFLTRNSPPLEAGMR